MTSPNTPAQITLTSSPTAGIVAIPGGEQYRWAQSALEQAGFQKRPDGTYALQVSDPDTTHAAVTNLVRIADRHRTTVTASNRRYLGDVADAIAAQLPGTWSATTEVYTHPAWQEDLIPWLWDAGELTHAVLHARIPYAAVLNNSARIQLLLIERPGHHHDYLIGAFEPGGFTPDGKESNTPRAIVIPAAPYPASRAITGRFLPAYHQALHTQHLTAVTGALGRLREEHHRWQAISTSGHFSDGTPVNPSHLPVWQRMFAERAWEKFGDFLTHAPALLDRCRPKTTAWPEDTAALERLRGALELGATALTNWNTTWIDLHKAPASPPAAISDATARRNAQVWPAIATWLTDGEALLRQAHATAPHPSTAPSSVPGRDLTTGPPALPAPPGQAPPHR